MLRSNATKSAERKCRHQSFEMVGINYFKKINRLERKYNKILGYSEFNGVLVTMVLTSTATLMRSTAMRVRLAACFATITRLMRTAMLTLPELSIATSLASLNFQYTLFN